MSRGPVVLLLLSLVLVSCGGGDAPLVECPGERPPIDQCYRGAFFAECGGSGDPRFACDEAGDCRWFTASCVAAGYETSPCGAYELCCQDGWPFAEGAISEEANRGLPWLINQFGRLPWDRVRLMRLTAALDSSLAPSLPSVTCTGTYPANGTPCGVPSPDTAVVHGGTLTVRYAKTGLFGWHLLVEVAQNPTSGVLSARVCQLPYTDVIVDQCPAQDQVECAVAGTVTLSRFPSGGDVTGVAMTVDVTFGADMGLRVETTL